MSTVGKHGDEAKIKNYVKNQGENYKTLHWQKPKNLGQLMLWQE